MAFFFHISKEFVCIYVSVSVPRYPVSAHSYSVLELQNIWKWENIINMALVSKGKVFLFKQLLK